MECHLVILSSDQGFNLKLISHSGDLQSHERCYFTYIMPGAELNNDMSLAI